jgi:hypothetical protein
MGAFAFAGAFAGVGTRSGTVGGAGMGAGGSGLSEHAVAAREGDPTGIAASGKVDRRRGDGDYGIISSSAGEEGGSKV